MCCLSVLLILNLLQFANNVNIEKFVIFHADKVGKGKRVLVQLHFGIPSVGSGLFSHKVRTRTVLGGRWSDDGIPLSQTAGIIPTIVVLVRLDRVVGALFYRFSNSGSLLTATGDRRHPPWKREVPRGRRKRREKVH